MCEEWTELDPNGNRPPVRAGHTAVLRANGVSMIVTGGKGQSQARSDLYQYTVNLAPIGGKV